MTGDQKAAFLLEFAKLLDKYSAVPATDEIPEVAYEDWVYPMPMWGTRKPSVSSQFSRDGSGPNTERYNHWGVDIMYRNKFRKTIIELPNTDRSGWWACPRGLPIINVAPGRCIMVDRQGMFSLTMEHRVPGVGQVLVHHKHLDRIYVDKGELYPAGHHIGMCGATGSDVNHDHAEVHEGRLGKGLKDGAWWKATAVDPEPILRDLRVVEL